jgi:hypothetical protein
VRLRARQHTPTHARVLASLVSGSDKVIKLSRKEGIKRPRFMWTSQKRASLLAAIFTVLGVAEPFVIPARLGVYAKRKCTFEGGTWENSKGFILRRKRTLVGAFALHTGRYSESSHRAIRPGEDPFAARFRQIQRPWAMKIQIPTTPLPLERGLSAESELEWLRAGFQQFLGNRIEVVCTRLLFRARPTSPCERFHITCHFVAPNTRGLYS